MDSPRLAQLSPEEKRAMLARLLKRKLSAAPAASPPSYGQRALWFLQRLDPDSAAYNLNFCARIHSPLDADVLRRALKTILDRHASLRTTFVERAEGPTQLVHPAAEPDLDVIDARRWSQDRLREELLAEAHTPFSLEQGPLLRTRLYERGPDDCMVLMTIHHIVSDFWTLGVLMEEMGQAYRAVLAGDEAGWPKPQSEYADFVRWQAELLSGPEGPRLEEYWRTALAGELPALNLPTDWPRSPVQSSRGAEHRFRIDGALTQQLRELARGEGATLFAVLLAAYQILLHRMTGQTDILVGSPVAGRSRPEYAGLVGYFVNMLVLRGRLDGQPTFREFLSQIRQTVLEGLNHGDYPFAQLVEKLQPVRDLSRHALFQAAFVLKRSQAAATQQRGDSGQMRVGGLDLELIELEVQAVPFDWNLMVEETADLLNASLQYNADLFHADTIRAWMGCFQTLLRGIVANPEARIADLPMLDDAERERILTWSRGKSADYPRETIHRLIEQQVARTPDRVAVVENGQSISYSELNARANRLARHLQSLGAGRDVPIGLCVERSTEMIVAALAILKSGGAYLPLDPTFPDQRLAFFVEDSGTPIVISRGSRADKLARPGLSIVRLDADAVPVDRLSADNIGGPSDPSQLAYVLYTSGSTGKPKGVMVPHGGVVNMLSAMIRNPGFTADDRFCALTTLGFDIHTLELWMPFMIGASTTVVSREVAGDGRALAKQLDRDRPTTYQATPATYRMLVAAEWTGDKKARAICGGEALTEDLATALLARVGTLWNMFGPTEASVYSSIYRVPSAENPMPIGRPVDNTQSYVLDSQGRLAPVGVPGELYIGGAGIARGYWNRPELTAERFVADPFASNPIARLYRTGDSVRWRHDGVIEYLGRLDFQVKVRGFRIELGEIEATLAQHTAVREAVVTAVADSGTQRLIAYVVPPEGTSAPSTSDLRTFLAGKLPDYMIPSAFVALPALPISPTGKVDRAALPAPDSSRPELATTYRAPRTTTEIAIAAIWSELLHVKKVGLLDNFFELGGHSLLATQVLSRVRADFGVEAPLRRFFESPTVANLASIVDELTSPTAKAHVSAAPLRVAPRDEPLPMSYGQETLWFLDQLVPGNSTYNVPAVVRVSGPLDLEALRRAFEAIVHRHESLRSKFALQDDQRIVTIGDPEPLEMTVVDLRDLPEAERERRATELTRAESRKPFDLAVGPLLRLTVLRLGDLDQTVLMTVHHIAYDGWSTGVLVREFAALYRGFLNDVAPTLPALPIQYPDFAYWQRQWLQTGLLNDQLNYWKKQLQGVPPLLALPTDRPRPHVWSFRGTQHPLHFPPSLVADLKALSRRESCTFFMTLLAAFQTLLHRYSGMDDICVGSPIANRNRVEVENLVGFVVNTLVLRGNLTGNPTFSELLKRTRETAIGAYGHQDLPFERLMQALNPNRDVRHSSLFQVLFVLQNAPVHLPPLPNLTPRLLIDSHNGTSKFDLTLGLTEMPEGLHGIFEYNTDLFDSTTIERMATHFRRLLEGVVADSSRRLSDLPLLDEAEQAQALSFGEGDRIDGPPSCFHRRFEAIVAKNPDAVAVAWGDQRMSYGELNRRANRLARELQSRGVVPDSMIGLYFERSIEMVVATLAALKSGGGYLPLDPALPRERLRVILEDASAIVVVTQDQLANDVPFDADRVIRLTGRPDELAHHSAENLANGPEPHNISYVIYTSGSTGVPKGCVMEHGSLDNAFVGWERAYGLRQLHAFMQMANFAFDVFTADLVRALGSGGKLVLCPSETLLDPEKLLALIRREETDYVEFVPAVMRPVLRHLEATRQDLGPVKIVVVGADVWYGGEYRRLRRAAGSKVRVINSYGLTEATIDNMYYEGSDEGLTDEGPIPIGRPYANQRTCILDAHGHVQPIGVSGELHMGGLALARGYLNQPELTADKFIPDPFHPGERLYKSGDLARMLPSGQIELLGRTDSQVKIRGFRIELGEIESTLTQHERVRDAAVVARDDGRGVKRLVAYVVLKDGEAAPTATDLRAFLASKLPEYMLPAIFVPLTALPLSPNGKVDRKALPSPEAGRGELAVEYVPPSSATEVKLAALWADVLRVERVGLRDSFFELGGHSLLATQVLARVRADFSVELPLRKLFEAPVLADFAAAIDAAERSRQGPSLQHIVDGGNAPLSYAQQRLWFLDQLEPGNPVYHVNTAVRINGALDRDVWERCFLAIGERHDILRTTFPAVDGRPVAFVAPTVELNVRDIDLSGLPIEDRESRAREVAVEEYRRPFDLARGPLFHIALLKLSAQEHILLLTMHHIIADGGSLAVFLRELAELSVRLSSGQTTALSPLPIQYADFARWQEQWLEGGERQRQLSFWRENLVGAPMTLDLTTDRPRPPIQTSRGAAETRVISAALADAIRNVSAQEGVTPFMTLLAAFQALLHRYTGQDDLLIGTPVSNRNRVEIEGLIGCFVNTLALRSRLSAGSSFRDLLGQTRENVMQALAHQELPFEALVDDLQPRRDPSRTPIFQVMFIWQTAPTAIQLPGLSLKTIPVDPGVAMFDLTIVVHDDEGEMTVTAEYNSDLYDAATIARMLRHFETLLVKLSADPSLDAARVPLIDDAERQQLLVDWNATALDYPRDRTVVDLIADRAQQSPKAVAVEDADGRSLTYSELDSRANAIASRLAAAGVQRESIVALCVERSLEMAVGLLGILKAGGAYLPLDPDYPADRLQFLLDDAGVSVIVTQKNLSSRLPKSNRTVVLLDEESKAQQRKWESPKPDDAAYVIYTSGSTGQPKGVVVTHRNLANLCAAVTDRYELSAADRVLQFTSLSFDVAVEEMFPAWVRGATVVLRPAGPVLGATELLRFVDDRRISFLELPTAYWHELTAAVKAASLAMPPSLRLIVFGGEAARPETIADWHRHVGNRVRAINAYGPTETTVTSIVYELPPNEPVRSTAAIGKPIGNTQVYLVDRFNELAPIGLPGELLIGGDGVARGYLNDPELTAERFISIADCGLRIADLHSRHVYRTGDRARWRPDGQLEFLGRLDQQVKIRGFRVEPGEIEAVLAQHPAVSVAAVVARQDVSGQSQLAAYVIPADNSEVDAESILAFLRTRVPHYMLPSAVVLSTQLPMTAGGKIDRRALASLDDRIAPQSTEYVAPRTETESAVAKVWEELFGRDRIGVEDGFFDLGGHSLMAVQLAARLSRALRRHIAVKAIVLYPTIAALAAALDSGAIVDEPERAPQSFAQANDKWTEQLGRYVHIERRPLLDLSESGELAPMPAAAIGYLPSSLLHYTGLRAEDVTHGLCGNKPIVSGIFETEHGQIATVLIPRFDSQLYQDQQDLLGALTDGLKVAHRIGAQTVSLTGLLPSATEYGRALARTIEGRDDVPRITTGHATTTATVVLAIRKILAEATRDLTRERVAFLGLGSVGTAVLRLMVRSLPHPREIRLTDVYGKRDALVELQHELRQLGYDGPVHLCETRGDVPDSVYDSTLYVGATNVSDILDIDRVAPGTLIVDDSAPHCFRTDKAIRRLRERGDILFTEGGTLWAPQPFRQVVYLPPELELFAHMMPRDMLPINDPRQITGCVFSSLLSTLHEHLQPTIGLVDGPTCVKHFDMLTQLRFDAAQLHCEGYVLEDSVVANFRKRFGDADVPAVPASQNGTSGLSQRAGTAKQSK
jgi:amino acid adenylation domain-containing protein